MSRILSPIPSFRGAYDAEPDACWWRLHPPSNQDDQYTILRAGPPHVDNARWTWASWEFFDGYDTVIDTGFDRPTPVIIHSPSSDIRFAVDVLSVGPPTPARGWRQFTEPGDYRHPTHPRSVGEIRCMS